MADAFARFIASRRDVAGVIGIGGSGGTALITPGMRALPVGTPKLMVSTVASGQVAGYVGPSDICMMYSVTDLAGTQPDFAHHPGERGARHRRHGEDAGRAQRVQERPAVGLTMFGVTTTCVNQVVAQLSQTHDCLVFHATGTGGQSMEKLADSGLLRGVIDVTTTEVCDLLMGGIFPATEDRFGAIVRTGLPYVGSCGALDMVNFGPAQTVPGALRGPHALSAQSAGHVDADDAGGKRPHGRMDRRAAEPVQRPGPFPDPRAGRVGARCAGRRRFTIRRRMRRCSPRSSAPSR